MLKLRLLLPAGLFAAPAIVSSVSFDFSRLISPKIVVDRKGNIVVGGSARTCAFPTLKPISTCGPAWVAKFDSTGQTLLFATYIGTPATRYVTSQGLSPDPGGE